MKSHVDATSVAFVLAKAHASGTMCGNYELSCVF